MMSTPSPLEPLFLPCCPAAAALPAAALERRLGELVAAGRAAWPAVPLPAEALIEHLARHAGEAPGPYLESVCVADLYLACACARGVAAALEAFERRLGEVAGAAARYGPAPAFVDEVRQIVREKLLVGTPGAAPRIAAYSGRGSLQAWLRVTVVRAALDLRARREDLPIGGEQELAAKVAPGGDLEVDYLRYRYQGEFQEALRAAFAALSARQRNLLRLHYVSGLTDEKIGAMLGVHQSTVSRQIGAARELLLSETRRLLEQRLRLSPAEFVSLAGLLRSRLHLSLAGLLRDTGG